MPITINGSGTITGLSAGGLPDGVIQPADLSTGGPYWDSSSNVGIGTSSPLSTAMLEVSRSTTVIPTATVTADNQVVGWRSRRTGGTYPREYYIGIRENSTALDFYDNTSNVLCARIDSNGNFAIPPSYNHTTASGANVFIRSDGYLQRSTSALKYKQDIRDYSGIDINALRPVLYKSKCEGDDQTKDHLGIVADEAHEAGITELVTYGAGGEVEGFQYERLTVVLLKAVQELNAKVEAQAAEIAILKGAA